MLYPSRMLPSGYCHTKYLKKSYALRVILTYVDIQRWPKRGRLDIPNGR